ncbi:hypothetical protein PI125_g24935 [Phytophthora idaei]|nr:hypothetical protein PI125_g24935 [Phytophthora idaei]
MAADVLERTLEVILAEMSVVKHFLRNERWGMTKER